MRNSLLVIFVTGSCHCICMIVGRNAPTKGKREKIKDIFIKKGSVL